LKVPVHLAAIPAMGAWGLALNAHTLGLATTQESKKMAALRLLFRNGASVAGRCRSSRRCAHRARVFSSSRTDDSDEATPPSTWIDRVRAAHPGRADDTSPPAPPPLAVVTAGLGAFAGMSALSVMHFGLTGGSAYTMIAGSMGASACLIFAAPAAPFSQPRNVIGGHVLSALIGVSTCKLFAATAPMMLLVPAATSCAIMAMQATRTLHPPAGGTVLIALMGSHGLAFPCTVGLTSTMLVAAGIAVNNLSVDRKYPTYWR
jgi:hypothetical protein